jgi:hypothetical protein
MVYSNPLDTSVKFFLTIVFKKFAYAWNEAVGLDIGKYQ